MGRAAAADVLGGWGGMVPASPDHAPAACGPLRPLTPQHEQVSRSGGLGHAVTTIASSFASSFVERSCWLAASMTLGPSYRPQLLLAPPPRPASKTTEEVEHSYAQWKCCAPCQHGAVRADISKTMSTASSTKKDQTLTAGTFMNSGAVS